MLYGVVILDVGIQEFLPCSSMQTIAESQEANLKKEYSPVAYALFQCYLVWLSNIWFKKFLL